jgi:hypothetical protein
MVKMPRHSRSKYAAVKRMMLTAAVLNEIEKEESEREVEMLGVFAAAAGVQERMKVKG